MNFALLLQVAALASLGLVAGQAHPGPAHVGAGNLQGGAHPGPAHVGAGNLQGGAHPCPAFVACRRRRDAQVPLWGYPAAAPLAWTGAGLPTPLDAAGLVYPAAEPYIHDPSGDSAVEYVHDTAGDRRRRQAVWAYPGVPGYPAATPWALGDYAGQVYVAAEPYVHDPTGDGADDASPAAEAYVHDASGDSSPAALPYVHDATGDRR